MERPTVVLFSLFVGLACSGPPVGVDAGDAGSDSGRDSAVVGPSPVAEAILPRLTCPPGWLEETLDRASGVSVCDAFGGPRVRCPGAAAHFPGEAGCRTIGTECPPDGLPVGMPADAIYVLAGSVGGDGTRGSPFGTIAQAVSAAGDGGTIAIGVGRYVESITLTVRLALRGACPDAVITHPTTAVMVMTPGAVLSNLTIEGAFAGLGVRSGDATVRDVFFLSCGTAAFSFGGGILDLADVIIRDARLTAISASGGAVRLARFAFEDLGDTAISISAATLSASDGVIDGIASDSTSLITITGESEATLERIALRASSLSEIIVDFSNLTATDIDSRATGVAPFPRYGITGGEASAIELTRVFFEGGSALGVALGGPGATLRLTDAVFLEMRPPEGGVDGHAIEVDSGATAVITRTWIERSVGIGLLASGVGATVTTEDLIVRDTLSSRDGTFGRGMQIQLGAHVTSSRALFADNREASVVVATSGSRWDATDVTIEDSAERACAASGCPPAGIGLSVFQSGSARLERFRIRRSALIGAQVAFDGSLTLIDGEIVECPIGANVQVPGYDLDRLRERVIYRDNGVNLDASELAIPEPVTGS